MPTFPTFHLLDFARFSVDWVNAHPAAQLVILVTGLILAACCAGVVHREQRKRDAAEDRRLRAIATAQESLTAQIRPLRVVK